MFLENVDKLCIYLTYTLLRNSFFNLSIDFYICVIRLLFSNLFQFQKKFHMLEVLLFFEDNDL